MKPFYSDDRRRLSSKTCWSCRRMICWAPARSFAPLESNLAQQTWRDRLRALKTSLGCLLSSRCNHFLKSGIQCHHVAISKLTWLGEECSDYYYNLDLVKLFCLLHFQLPSTASPKNTLHLPYKTFYNTA